MLYSSFQNEINDRMGNSYFTDNSKNELLRATNAALRDINVGKVSDKPDNTKRRIAYDFQREETDLTYLSGTVRYSLVTSIPTLSDLKWVDNILINTDEDFNFTKRDANYFRRRRGVNKSTERIFAEEYINGTKYLLIYHSESNTLNIIWYSNYMVKSGSTRSQYLPSTSNDNYEFLIPEEFIDSVVDLTCANLYLQDRNEQSTSYKTFLNSGRATLQQMINQIGIREKKAVNSLKVKSEWGIYESY
jgi:hypothetical protein